MWFFKGQQCGSSWSGRESRDSRYQSFFCSVSATSFHWCKVQSFHLCLHKFWISTCCFKEAFPNLYLERIRHSSTTSFKEYPVSWNKQLTYSTKQGKGRSLNSMAFLSLTTVIWSSQHSEKALRCLQKHLLNQPTFIAENKTKIWVSPSSVTLQNQGHNPMPWTTAAPPLGCCSPFVDDLRAIWHLPIVLVIRQTWKILRISNKSK